MKKIKLFQNSLKKIHEQIQEVKMVKTEYFDIYNGTGKPLGISKPKNEVHNKEL